MAINAPNFGLPQRTFVAPIRIDNRDRGGGGGGLAGTLGALGEAARLGTTMANYFQGLDEADRKQKAEGFKSLQDLGTNLDLNDPANADAFRKQAMELLGDEEAAENAYTLVSGLPKTKEFRTNRNLEGIHQEMEGLRDGSKEQGQPAPEAQGQMAPPQQGQQQTEIVAPQPDAAFVEGAEGGMAGPPTEEVVPGQPFVEGMDVSGNAMLPLTETATPPVQTGVLPDGVDAAEPALANYDDIQGSIAPGFMPLRMPTEGSPPTTNDLYHIRSQMPAEPNPNPDPKQVRDASHHVRMALSYFIEEKANLGQSMTKEDMALLSASDAEFKRGMRNLRRELYNVVSDEAEVFNTGHNRDVVITAQQIKQGNEQVIRSLGPEGVKEILEQDAIIPLEIKELYQPIADSYSKYGVDMSRVMAQRAHYQSTAEERGRHNRVMEQNEARRIKYYEDKAAKDYNLRQDQYKVQMKNADIKLRQSLGKNYMSVLDKQSKLSLQYAQLEADQVSQRDAVMKSVIDLGKIPNQTPEGKLVSKVMGQNAALIKSIAKGMGDKADDAFMEDVREAFSGSASPDVINKVMGALESDAPHLKKAYEMHMKDMDELLRLQGMRRGANGQFEKLNPGTGQYELYDPASSTAQVTVMGPNGKAHKVNILGDPAEAYRQIAKLQGVSDNITSQWEDLDVLNMQYSWMLQNPGSYVGMPSHQFNSIKKEITALTSPKILEARGTPLSRRQYENILKTRGYDPIAIRTSYDAYLNSYKRRSKNFQGDRVIVNGKDAQGFVAPTKGSP